MHTSICWGAAPTTTTVNYHTLCKLADLVLAVQQLAVEVSHGDGNLREVGGVAFHLLRPSRHDFLTTPIPKAECRVDNKRTHTRTKQNGRKEVRERETQVRRSDDV